MPRVEFESETFDLLNRIAAGCEQSLSWVIGRAVNDFLVSERGTALLRYAEEATNHVSRLRYEIGIAAEDVRKGRVIDKPIDEILDEIDAEFNIDPTAIELELPPGVVARVNRIAGRFQEPTSWVVRQAIDWYLLDGEGADIMAFMIGKAEIEAGDFVDANDLVLALDHSLSGNREPLLPHIQDILDKIPDVPPEPSDRIAIPTEALSEAEMEAIQAARITTSEPYNLSDILDEGDEPPSSFKR